jgi:hypothetical protein
VDSKMSEWVPSPAEWYQATCIYKAHDYLHLKLTNDQVVYANHRKVVMPNAHFCMAHDGMLVSVRLTPNPTTNERTRAVIPWVALEVVPDNPPAVEGEESATVLWWNEGSITRSGNGMMVRDCGCWIFTTQRDGSFKEGDSVVVSGFITSKESSRPGMIATRIRHAEAEVNEED